MEADGAEPSRRWIWPKVVTRSLRDLVVNRQLLFGLRLSAAVCLALYLAFWLQLDNAYWAGVTAVIVSQPSLGASLRKSASRFLGTAVGATVVVFLAGCFLQDRVCFLGGLALWAGACGFAATTLRNQASYGAALAGYTSVIVAGSVLGPSGYVTGDVFTVALTRATEIWIGIVAARIVFVGTTIGRAREQLVVNLAKLGSEIGKGLFDCIANMEFEPFSDKWNCRQRELFARAIGLSSQFDEVVGEEYDLSRELPQLRASVSGSLAALAGWQRVANCLERTPVGQRRAEAARIHELLPSVLVRAFGPDGLSIWLDFSVEASFDDAICCTYAREGSGRNSVASYSC